MKCDKCQKEVFKKGQDWKFLNKNPKFFKDHLEGIGLLSVDLNLLKRLCNSCFKKESK